MLRALGLPPSSLRCCRAPLRRRSGPARERKGLASHAMPTMDKSKKRKVSEENQTFNDKPVPLSYSVYDGPSPQPPLVFLHGLFGSKSNFSSLAKKLVLQTGRKVLTVDARNHGDSPHSPSMSYEAMSGDVQLLLRQLRLSRCVLVGHSMGGKTAMALALTWPELVERLVCVDIGPSRTAGITRFHSFIAALRAVDIPSGIPRSTARRLAEEQLQPAIQEPAIRQFLLTNLVYAEERFTWRVNLESISQHLDELLGFPDFQAPYLGPVLFLGGSQSGYISARDRPEIGRLFPEAEVQHVPDAGHWVHADQPQQFLAAVCRFLEHRPL